MGLIRNILGIGRSADQIGGAVERVAEVFTPNRTKQVLAEHAEHIAVLNQFGQEFTTPHTGRFNGFVNALNRLPRPMLALGTLGLFIFAMVDPSAFSLRMQGLNAIPQPLWWLLGAIVSFYFGAREMHYHRAGGSRRLLAHTGLEPAKIANSSSRSLAIDPDANAAFEDWRRSHG